MEEKITIEELQVRLELFVNALTETLESPTLKFTCGLLGGTIIPKLCYLAKEKATEGGLLDLAPIRNMVRMGFNCAKTKDGILQINLQEVFAMVDGVPSWMKDALGGISFRLTEDDLKKYL